MGWEVSLVAFGVRIALSAALAAGGIGAVQAQDAKAPAPAAAQDQEIVVKGIRMPSAEAPRSALCEALARDPMYRAQVLAAGTDPYMGPRAYTATRLPRNPDYSRPPIVPAGSALPQLGKTRFGARALGGSGDNMAADSGQSDTGDIASADIGGGDTSTLGETTNSLGNALQACRSGFNRGGENTNGQVGFASAASTSLERAQGAFNVGQRQADAAARAVAARSEIAARDTTLPMAFALFDQGRYVESLDYFKRAANKLPFRDGGDEATLFIGKLYLQGIGDKSDPQEALKWLKKAATTGFNASLEMPQFDPREPERNTATGEAAMILANIYRVGFKGIAKDPEESRKWYARAFEVGHVAAAKTLGDIYFRGLDTPRDIGKALTYYRRAAKLDHPGAQVALADILMSGTDGVAQDRKEALSWYQAAAKHGDPDGLVALARAYDFGEGVVADPDKAAGYYKDAALHGSAAGMTALGTYFYEGKILPKNLATARAWFESAARSRDVDGMVNLSAMLIQGQGGPKDLSVAWRWLSIASKLGNANATTALAAVEKRMTPSEKQAAGVGQ